MIDSDLKSSLVRDKKLWINESAYYMDHICTVVNPFSEPFSAMSVWKIRNNVKTVSSTFS